MSTQDNHTPELPKARRDFHKKGGRPQKAERDKKKAISSYYDDHERSKLENQSKEAGGMPLGIYIHNQAMYGKVVQALPDDIADAIKQMAGMSNNLNQVTRQFNAAFKDNTDRRMDKLANLIPQLEYQSKMIGQLLIFIASLCSQR